jgi:hypothetical protein
MKIFKLGGITRQAVIGLVWMLAAGVLVGMGLNLAFGSAFSNLQGILGGLVSGLLIYLVS